mgnify:FL=1
MKRKVISAVLAATMAVTMMMGCGSTGTSADGNGSTSKSEESGNDGGKVTLKYSPIFQIEKQDRVL